MTIKKIAILFFICLTFAGNTQNLISNQSFEDFYILPQNFIMVEDKDTEILPRWWFLSTPDYFHQNCTATEVRVPNNFAGSNKAKQGKAYAGFILRADPQKYKLRGVPDSEHYCEHLENVLDSALVKDQMYCCKLYLSLSEFSGLAVDGFGLYFSKELVIFKDKNDVLQYKPQIENKDGNILFVQKGWMEFAGIFKASGGEKYVTIGNFKSLKDTKYLRIKPTQKVKTNLFAYYYIDDISLIPITDTSECVCTATSYTLNKQNTDVQTEVVPYATNWDKETVNNDTLRMIYSEQFGTIEFGKPVILNNIYFNFDKFDLLEKSFEELDILFEILDSICQTCSISIEGHTDSYGSNQYNIDLSNNRAQSVADYLIHKGIAGARISFVGYGRSKPIASNQTDEGRQKNRRVEFIIKKQ